MDGIVSHGNTVSECQLAKLQQSIPKLAAMYFVPRCVNRRGSRKLIEYERRFESAYQSQKLPASIREKILSTLLTLFVEPYSSASGQGSFQTHQLNSASLRREGWIQGLRGSAWVSRVNDEWRIVWSMSPPNKIVVHATCRHQDLYSTE